MPFIWPSIGNIKGLKGDSLRNPRRSGDNVIVDQVVTNQLTGAETTTAVDLGNFRGAKPTDAEVASIIGYSVHYGPTPPPSWTKYGLPVEWRDTRPKDAWTALPPTRNDSTLTITIPDDFGATYRVAGVDKAPGVYTVAVGTTWAITAHAKTGYQLAGPASWSLTVTGVVDLPNLKAAILADAPHHYITLKGGDLTDLGSAPLTWTNNGVVGDTWGSTFTDTSTVTSNAAAGIGVLGGLTNWSVEITVDLNSVADVAHQTQRLFGQGGDLSHAVAWQGAIEARGFDTASRLVSAPASTTNANLAHHCLTAGGGTLTLYTNGVSKATVAYTQSRSLTTALSVGGPFGMLGQGGHFALYRGKTLTAARVLAHAQAAGTA